MKSFKINGKKHWAVEVEPNSTDFGFSKSGRWFLWKRYMLVYNNYFPSPRITLDTSVRFRKKPTIVGIAKKCLGESCREINNINPDNLIISAKNYPKRMKKLEKRDVLPISILIALFIVLVVLATLFCLGCQSPKDQSGGCTITYKAGIHKFTVDCKDSIFYTEFEIDTIIY